MSSDPSPKGSEPRAPGKKRRRLSAEKKYQIFLEAQQPGQPIGEMLRREGLYSTDLARIRQQVKDGALQRLSAKPGRQAETVSREAYEALQEELQQKERALADLSVELTVLRKKTNGGSWAP
jgi:transposase-like protein